MLLNKQIQISVFQIDNAVFDRIGEVNQYDSLIWPDKFNGYASFELWAPITDENSLYFKKGNVLWCGGDNACMIEIVKEDIDDVGTKVFNVKGRTLEMLLTTRIVWGTYKNTNQKTSTIMYALVNENCVNPSDSSRKIPYLECAEDALVGLTIDSYQKTGGEVYDALYALALESDIGFSVLFRPREQKLIFEVVEGRDLTLEQTTNDPVIFSTELEDILSSSYYSNNQDMKSVALIAGEGEGTERTQVITGNNSTTGFERRELYVDARDLQSTSIDSEGNQTSLSPEEYRQVLTQRGDEKLSECKVVDTFEAQIRVFGDVQYEFGKDYRKGDMITVRDKNLDVMISARITEVEECYDEEYALVLTFGYSYPTIMEKIKRSTASNA